MTTDDKLGERGVLALQVLENPAFQEAMLALKADVHSKWLECPIRDSEGQLLLLQLARLTNKFEGILKGMIESGKLADNRINLHDLRAESRVKRALRSVVG